MAVLFNDANPKLATSILPISLLVLSLLTKSALSKEYGVVQLTSANFEDTVINGGEEAWIVAVQGAGNIALKKWAELEVKLRGMMVKVGIVDPQTDGAFLKRMGFLKKDKTYSVARVYPYGGYKIKVAGLQDVSKLSKANNLALQSIPDQTRKIQNGQELEGFVNDAYASKPPRFPVLLFSDKRVALPEYRAVALKYSKYFHFGVMRNPDIEFRLKFVVETLPSIVVMLGSLDAKSRMLTFNSVRYDIEAYGALTYFTLAKFLFSVHEKHWKEQPKVKNYRGKMELRTLYLEDIRGIQETKQSFREKSVPEATLEDETVSPVVVQITHENHGKLCTDSTLGLCVISYLDGRNQRSVMRSLRVLRDVQKAPEIDGKPFQYLWVNASCHPEYGENFGISSESLPTLLVVYPRQRLFTIMKENFEKANIGSFLSAVSLGQNDLQRYSRFNEMIEVDCQKLQPTIGGTGPTETTLEDTRENGESDTKANNPERAREEL